MSYNLHENCRACGYGPPASAKYCKCDDGSQRLASVLDLGVLPLPNAFRKAGESRPGHYPLELLICPRCTLGQLSAVVDPLVMYANYPYVTSTSQTMQAHFERLWEVLNRERKIETVVEIGSNDGLCLEQFTKFGAQHVMGIDPAENLTQIANARGVRSITALFDAKAAELVRGAMPEIDLILARHVFCHIDDWKAFVRDLSLMCGKDTIICLEAPWAHELISDCEWDTVYAEHLSYLTIKAVQHLLAATTLRLQNVVHFPVHGGTLALVLRRADAEGEPAPAVAEFVAAERCELTDWNRFAQTARDQITNLKLLVRDLREQGKTVAGYGASAKSTMWINAMGLGPKDIRGVYDSTPQKWYSTIPGTRIPVLHEGAFYVDCPDYAVVWAWNYLDEILKKQQKWKAEGGKFIVPVPTVKIL